MLSENQKINIQLPNEISLYIKREDLLHPFISGNKFRKLKYNLEKIGYDTLVTFGGAYSNHIAATAYACKQKNINCVGVIRGEELIHKISLNPTLEFAQECGMKFEFVSRESYRGKDLEDFIRSLKVKYGDCYILPEGGTNHLAVKGCQEILNEIDAEFDFIACAVGTGGTLAGLINASSQNQTVIGFPALKGDFLTNEIRKFASQANWKLIMDYHFGGYGKVSEELIGFINWFYKVTNIPLDPIYTGKLVFGVLDLIEKKYFPEGSKIVMIHTGGIQGVAGMNQVLKSKNRNTIQFDE